LIDDLQDLATQIENASPFCLTGREPYGRSLTHPLRQLADWSLANKDAIAASRQRWDAKGAGTPAKLLDERIGHAA
jgi:hypothetical protein